MPTAPRRRPSSSHGTTWVSIDEKYGRTNRSLRSHLLPIGVALMRGDVGELMHSSGRAHEFGLTAAGVKYGFDEVLGDVLRH